ncbi:unnamed protein product [Camellia sinensis]
MSFSLPLKSQQSRSTEVILHSLTLSLSLCLSLDFLNPAMASDRNHNSLPNVPFLNGFAASMKEIIEQEKLKKSRTTKTTANNTRTPIETTATTEHGIPMTLGTSQPLVTNDKNVSIPTSLMPAPAAQVDQSATLLSMSSMHQQKNPKFGTSTPWSRLLSKHPLNGDVTICMPVFNIGLNQSGHLIIGDHAMSMILCRTDQRQKAQRRSLDPLAEIDKTKYYLLASFVLHIKHSSEIYQEKSSKALAHHFGAKLLVFHSRLYLSGSFTTGPKQILEALRVPVSQKTKNRCFKSVGPNFGSQGKIVLTSENSNSFKVGVRIDKPIPEGQDLGGLCEADHGFFCNASELQPESTTLKDLQKSINNILLENSKEKECYCGKQEKEKFLDEMHKAVLKRQFANDFEFLKSRGKLYLP